MRHKFSRDVAAGLPLRGLWSEQNTKLFSIRPEARLVIGLSAPIFYDHVMSEVNRRGALPAERTNVAS